MLLIAAAFLLPNLKEKAKSQLELGRESVALT